MRKTGKRVALLLLMLAFFVGINGLGQLLMPPRRDYGSTWASYLQEERDSVEVLFFGSSLVYCDVIPAVIWEETGLHTYVMAGPEQTMPITYYYVKEACRTQSPRAVVVELNGLFFEEYQSFTRVNIGYMPWMANRLGATLRGAERDAIPGLLWPIYEYHDRVYSITPRELKENLWPEGDDYAGYTLLYDAVPQEQVTYRPYEAGTPVYERNLSYLRKISDFCRREGMELVLYVAPARARIPEEALMRLREDLQRVPHLVFWDCNDGTWPEADEGTQWYDALHYNVYGATAFSRELGARLKELGFTPLTGDDTRWQERVDALQRALARIPAEP